MEIRTYFSLFSPPHPQKKNDPLLRSKGNMYFCIAFLTHIYPFLLNYETNRACPFRGFA